VLSNSGTKCRTGTVRLEPIPTKPNENIPSRPGIDIAGHDLIVSDPKNETRERLASLKGGLAHKDRRHNLLSTENINKSLT